MTATHPTMSYANYLPDELLLEIVAHIRSWERQERQTVLARFAAVNRWVTIRQLYESPYLSGGAYDLFIRTICPSVIERIKPTALASLVKELDLSHIVHQGNKSTTARLLGRTKASLEVFVAPQASFAINCWASLSKCSRLRVLDLSFTDMSGPSRVSECINHQSLNQTIRQLVDLRELCLPRCSSRYEQSGLSTNVRWPPRLQHLSLSGSVSGMFLWDMLRQPDNFPPTFSSLSIHHSPGLDQQSIKPLLHSLSSALTTLSLRDLPAVKQGRFNSLLAWLPHLTSLTIALDYIDSRFGSMPPDFTPTRWREAKPLRSLTIVSCGRAGDDPARSFTPTDLYSLIDERWLGRLRYLSIGQSTEWDRGVEMEEQLGALEALLLEELDRENWVEGRWHYEGVAERGMEYETWIKETSVGRKMRPRFRVLKNR
ncbi:f-box domain [Pyrenophora seminiperda CCB06]|uniref:F-box domain n=1 Tax=Pyrenophora seminiperda CCB06 TaxID=1302712 RepID=A0A3M7MEJ1_9PLEO|nr:f-box domain [Pyrenophora seminiperda CCB06]